MSRVVLLEHRRVSVTLDSSPAHAKVGGEGTVHFVVVDGRRLAVKIFKEPGKFHRKERVAAWIARPPRAPDLDGYQAWAMPIEMVVDPVTGEFLGYAMRAVAVAGEAVGFLDFSLAGFWPFAQRAGFLLKLLAAYGELESHPYKPIFCDFSFDNTLVDERHLPIIIDVDSFQITASRNGKPTTLVSPARRPEYLAPELQGADFQTEVRGPEHHNFALAVGAYQVLMGNRHPYMCAPTPAGGYEEMIRRGAFPLAPGSRFAPPPGARAEWDALRPGLRDLFLRTFDGRPDPKSRPSIAEFREEVAREVASPHPRPPQAAARPVAPRRGAITFNGRARPTGPTANARPAIPAAPRISRRPALPAGGAVSHRFAWPRIVAAVALAGSIGGLALYKIAAGPAPAAEAREIVDLRASLHAGGESPSPGVASPPAHYEPTEIARLRALDGPPGRGPRPRAPARDSLPDRPASGRAEGHEPSEVARLRAIQGLLDASRIVTNQERIR
jgi:hypothetical protein